MTPVRYPNLKKDHVAVRKRHLPHWELAGCAYFVTFRCNDSLSVEEQDKIRAMQERLGALVGAEARAARRKFFQFLERRLDLGRGRCLLAQPQLAALVAGALAHFDRDRYDLGAWCIMPNHVHAIVAPNEDRSLAVILQSWKSYTAKAINRAIGGSGPFWQEESFDHLIRSPRDHERFERYVRDNPRRAGLANWAWVSGGGETTI